MLHKIKGKHVLECDSCGDTFEDDSVFTFDEFICSSREAGWLAKKSGKKWFHTCKSCADEDYPNKQED